MLTVRIQYHLFCILSKNEKIRHTQYPRSTRDNIQDTLQSAVEDESLTISDHTRDQYRWMNCLSDSRPVSTVSCKLIRGFEYGEGCDRDYSRDNTHPLSDSLLLDHRKSCADHNLSRDAKARDRFPGYRDPQRSKDLYPKCPKI